MNVGRPTLYDPSYCDRIKELATEGKSVSQWSASIGVARTTLLEWCNHHPEFLTAFNEAKTLEQAWWENAAQGNLGNKNFNGSLWAKSAMARFRQEYTERRELAHSGLPEPQITRIERVIIDHRAPDKQEIIPRYDAKLIENKKD